MYTFYNSETMQRIQQRLERLYPTRANDCIARINMLIGRYGIGFQTPSTGQRWDQSESILITYGDSILNEDEAPLQTLKTFLHHHVMDAIRTVHILPFFPYSSDDGFSVIDYRKVNPELGDWSDVRSLGTQYRLMFDLVINHCSRKSKWFRDYVLGIAPASRYFIEESPTTDLSMVVRPRTSDLLTKVTSRRGKSHLWCTFSEDQLDVDFSNPDVLFEYLDFLLFYISQGAKIIRLDAIAYLWKEIGTSCIHHPNTHEVVKLIRDFLEIVAPDVIILTETNVPHQENISYFGDGDEAHMVYQFSLPPLVLHALTFGNSRYLTQWASNLAPPPEGCTFFNFTSSHDGVGVRPLEGLVPDEEFSQLVDVVKQHGGHVSSKANPDGSESPYELNITYFDALCVPGQPIDDVQINRFLCSQMIAMSFRGVPAFYIHCLTSTRNDYEGVMKTGRARSINRKRWMLEELELQMLDHDGYMSIIFHKLMRRLRVRAQQAAFHPDGPQEIIDLGNTVFALLRSAPDQSQKILSIHSLVDHSITVSYDSLLCVNGRSELFDLIMEIPMPTRELTMNPYQTVWLVCS